MLNKNKEFKTKFYIEVVKRRKNQKLSFQNVFTEVLPPLFKMYVVQGKLDCVSLCKILT